MPTGIARQTAVVFNVEQMRALLIEHARPSADLLQKAYDKLEKKLEAKVTKFFPFQGTIVSKVDVEDHPTQMSAADKILALAGVYARERDAKPPTPAVAIEVDQITGVIRLVIGAPTAMAVADVERELPLGAAVAEPMGDVSDSSQLALPEDVGSAESAPKIIQMRNGTPRAEAIKLLFGEDG